MKVVRLSAENFKRLKAVQITPAHDGSLVVVAGANAQGKSSVLDAIWAALAGPKGYSVSEPVRQGEDGARVEVNLGELIVTRTWDSSGRSTLKVATPAGMSPSGPQGVLDGLLGRLSFDPLAFANAKAIDQRRTLLDLTGLDLDGFESRRKATFDQRTEVNREVKRAQAQLQALPAVDPSTPDELVPAALTGSLLVKARDLDSRIANLRSEHDGLQVELKRIEARIEEVLTAGREMTQERLKIGESTEQLEQALGQADELNERVRVKKQRIALEGQVATQQAASADLTNQLAGIDREQDQAVTSADLPAPGLGFTQDGVTLNGVPFSQASAAERLRTSLAIAMAMNPQIRVIRITDGSLLDKANLALIEQMAAEADFQVWVERVDESGDVGIIIEDGEVRS